MWDPFAHNRFECAQVCRNTSGVQLKVGVSGFEQILNPVIIHHGKINGHMDVPIRQVENDDNFFILLLAEKTDNALWCCVVDPL